MCVYIYKIFSYTSHLRFRGFSLLSATHPREDWTGDQMSHGSGSNSSTTWEDHEAFSLCLGRSMMGLEAAGISLHPPTHAAIPGSPPHPTHHWHFGLFSLSQQAALAKRLHSGHSTAPSPSSRLDLCHCGCSVSHHSNLRGALSSIQVLNGTQALVRKQSWGRSSMFAWHWSVLRAPALPCKHSQGKSECVQHDLYPGISPSLFTQQKTLSLHSPKHTGIAPSAVRNGRLAWGWWYFPNKLILLLVHPSFTDRESFHPAQLWAGRLSSGLFFT